MSPIQRNILIFFYVLSLATSCDPYDRPQISITTPLRGTFIPDGVPVEVLVTGPSEDLENIILDEGENTGYRENREDVVALIKPPKQGLGFVSAELPDDPYLVNRSWLQGTFIPSMDWYANTLKLRLTPAALNEGSSSISALIRSTLLNTELADFVDPIDVDLGVDRAQIIIESAVIEEMELNLSISGQQLLISLDLIPLRLSYRIESGVLRSSGMGRYDRISMQSDTHIDPTGLSLVNPEIELSQLMVQDQNIPGFLLNPILDALRNEFQTTITNAISEVTHQVTAQLFDQLRPTLGLALTRPISQQTELISVDCINDGLELSYQTKVAAIESSLGRSNIGALLSSPPQQANTGEGSSVQIGIPLLNQFAFAAWDAGNFENLSYSRTQLQNLGLGELEFPYSNLERAKVDLRLPPVAGWGEGGAYLELGEVQVDMKIDLSKNTKAWTAAQVPIRLELSGDGVRLRVDERREITVRPIMLNQLSILAERAEVLKLIHAALPGVVADVFGQIPMISIPMIQVQGLSNAPLLSINPMIIGIREEDDQWCIDLNLMINTL